MRLCTCISVIRYHAGFIRNFVSKLHTNKHEYFTLLPPLLIPIARLEAQVAGINDSLGRFTSVLSFAGLGAFNTGLWVCFHKLRLPSTQIWQHAQDKPNIARQFRNLESRSALYWHFPFLSCSGADVNLPDYRGLTPLKLARRYGQGCNSINIINFGHEIGPRTGPNTVLGH